MRAIFTSGSVGRVPGNRCLYPEFQFERQLKNYYGKGEDQIVFGKGM